MLHTVQWRERGNISANESYRAGLANLFWWVDREKGVAGMIASQILPFNDAEVGGVWVNSEAAVYAALGGD